ncbi:NACHT, LRR and PYD domains-containing protein 5 [Thomomys bottae]
MAVFWKMSPAEVTGRGGQRLTLCCAEPEAGDGPRGGQRCVEGVASPVVDLSQLLLSGELVFQSGAPLTVSPPSVSSPPHSGASHLPCPPPPAMAPALDKAALSPGWSLRRKQWDTRGMEAGTLGAWTGRCGPRGWVVPRAPGQQGVGSRFVSVRLESGALVCGTGLQPRERVAGSPPSSPVSPQVPLTFPGPGAGMEVDRLPVLSGFRLQWLLQELDKEEFRVFKETLWKKYLELMGSVLPRAQLEPADRAHLAFLLHEYFEGPLAWLVTSNILEGMDLQVLAQEAQGEMRRKAHGEKGCPSGGGGETLRPPNLRSDGSCLALSAAGESPSQIEDFRMPLTEQEPEEKKAPGRQQALHRMLCQEVSNVRAVDPELPTQGWGSGDENSAYKDHVLTKYSQKQDGRPEANPTDGLDMQTLAGAFDADPKGFRPGTVVLQAPSGAAQRALSHKILRCWAQGTLFCDLFSYVFLLPAGELQTGTKDWSLVELMDRQWPNRWLPVAQILSQPQRLLFVVDGLEELEAAWWDGAGGLCEDCAERRPVAVLMCSLLQKALLPASSLLITATGVGIEQFKALVVSPRYLVITGLSVESRAELEDCTADGKEALVLGSVLTRHRLLDPCQESLVCGLLCAALRLQEEGPGPRGPQLADQTLTSLYTTYLFHQLAPDRPCLAKQEREALQGLCGLAAHGLWGGRTLFHHQHLQAHGLREADVGALVGSGLLLQQEGGHAFLHPSLQAFCAALFYALGELRRWPRGHLQPVPDPKPGGLSQSLLWVKHFLFGFLSPGVKQTLEARLGPAACRGLGPLLRRWVWLLGCSGSGSAAPDDVLDAFHCLFETQDEAFVCTALSDFQDVRLQVCCGMDLLVTSFCLQRCLGLASLHIHVRDLFLPDELQEMGPAALPSRLQPACSPRSALEAKAAMKEQWEHFCSMLGSHPGLRQLHLGSSVLSEWAIKTLCVKLTCPSCHIQTLVLKNAELSSSLRHLWKILATNLNLKHINLSSTPLKDQDVEVACEALRHPNCALTSLRLDSCELSPEGSRMLSQVLSDNVSLTSLSLARNKLTDQSLQHLCDALKSLQCPLRRLILDSCGLTDTSLELLASALRSNPHLTHLCLSNNHLGASGLSLLCQPLKQPGCALQRLVALMWVRGPGVGRAATAWSVTGWRRGMDGLECKSVAVTSLNRCHLEATSCGFLVFALLSNPGLTHVSLSGNPLQDGGLQLLCQALEGPSCHLQDLELASCDLTSASCKYLATILAQNKHLRSLDLAANALGDSGVAALCEGLKPKRGFLSRLGLEACGLTSDCCAILSSTLSYNQYLTSLNLLRNDFSPMGVTLLCSAFSHPKCGLRTVGLWKGQYPASVRMLLEEVQQQKPQLVIGGDWYSEGDDRCWWKD